MSIGILGPETAWAVFADAVTLRTEARQQFIDLTELVAERVRRSGVQRGIVSIQTRHTTTAVVVNEDEPLLQGDMERMLERLAPRDLRYDHDDLSRRLGVPPDERANGAAHCRSLLLGSTQALHVIDGAVALGPWQRILFLELDGPRPRTISILVMGARGDHG
jgi:secondary thiamine-phosphate synthase enzyme